jgi:UDPglucose 6-dehydrogenase
VLKYFDGDIEGKRIAMWGLAFKAKTDDVRESPALIVAEILAAKGATVVAFDPKAMPNAQHALGPNKRIQYADDEYEAVNGADALAILTNWDAFQSPDFPRILSSMKRPVIVDGRNMYDLPSMGELGVYYESIGRPVIDGIKEAA